MGRFWGRLDVGAVLIFAVLLLAVLGSFLPQISPAVEADPERWAQWEAGARARYGGLMDLLTAAGAFRWFRSPGVVLVLVLLVAATFVCTLGRWRGVWRRAFHRPVRCPDAVFDRGPHVAALKAPSVVDLLALVRRGLEGKGFRVGTTEVGPADGTAGGRIVYLRGDRNRLAPLATLVTHAAVVLLLAGAALSSAFGWREVVTIGPGETAEVGHGSGLALRNEGFAIQRYPGGSVAGYEAAVAVVDAGREAARGTVRVNGPLNYKGVRLLLQAYAETPDGARVTLLAVRDPGYGPVIAAGFLLLLGMTVTFNFPHCCVHARIGPQGTLRLAGRADRRACDFGREFAAFVEGVERAVGVGEEVTA